MLGLRNEGHVLIIGKEKLLVVAYEQTEREEEWGVEVDASFSNKTSGNIPAEEWVIYEHQ